MVMGRHSSAVFFLRVEVSDAMDPHEIYIRCHIAPMPWIVYIIVPGKKFSGE